MKIWIVDVFFAGLSVLFGVFMGLVVALSVFAHYMPDILEKHAVAIAARMSCVLQAPTMREVSGPPPPVPEPILPWTGPHWTVGGEIKGLEGVERVEP